ncbi:UNKNOWN [Stylonychia lemnae]|uniref:Uncharacterized protein n=1 Tax=Stylonychia lemnae TaxID=5949 RepID=A0A078AQD3_STYLE|nr:UNKNOWN [Stylonychia lemnae]|eukprot:CDW83153.1 UNKNOWN [Stylonychia lemnae]
MILIKKLSLSIIQMKIILFFKEHQLKDQENKAKIQMRKNFYSQYLSVQNCPLQSIEEERSSKFAASQNLPSSQLTSIRTPNRFQLNFQSAGSLTQRSATTGKNLFQSDFRGHDERLGITQATFITDLKKNIEPLRRTVYLRLKQKLLRTTIVVQLIRLRKNHKVKDILLKREKVIHDRVIISNKAKYAPEFDYLQTSHLPFLPQCCKEQLLQQQINHNESQNELLFKHKRDPSQVGINQQYDHLSSTGGFESFLGNNNHLARSMRKFSSRKNSVKASIIKVGYSPQRMMKFGISKKRTRCITIESRNKNNETIADQKKMDQMDKTIKKLNKHNYDLEILTNEKQCSKIINGELILLIDKLNLLAEFLNVNQRKIRTSLFHELDEKQKTGINKFLEKIIAYLVDIGCRCIREYQDHPERIGVCDISQLLTLDDTQVEDEFSAFDENFKSIITIQEFVIDCSDAFYVLQREPDRKKTKSREAQELLDLIQQCRIYTLEIVLKIKQMFKALKRLDYKPKSRSPRKSNSPNKSTYNPPLERRKTFKEIMEMKKLQKLKELELLEKEQEKKLQKQRTINQKRNVSFSQGISSDSFDTSSSSDESEPSSPLIKAQSIRNPPKQIIRRKTLYEMKQEEKAKMQKELHKLKFEKKMSKSSISKKTSKMIHNMLDKMNIAENVLTETQLNKRDPEFCQKIEQSKLIFMIGIVYMVEVQRSQQKREILIWTYKILNRYTSLIKFISFLD